MLSAIISMPAFSILFRPIEKVLRFGVPFNPFAIYAAPNVPNPQLLIKSTYKVLACYK